MGRQPAEPGVWTTPNWVPDGARHYLLHTETGVTIRALARAAGLHASTVLRQVRRFESRRDDPLIDEGLRQLGRTHFAPVAAQQQHKEARAVLQTKFASDTTTHTVPKTPETAELAREGRRILRRLCETGAVLAVARDMEKAVVVRDLPDGGQTRTAVVAREVAQAMALNDWITCADPSARIARYRISTAG
ncbi:MAG: helix-turn-helix domain containing protein, partial [Pseudomonadota bacterium]